MASWPTILNIDTLDRERTQLNNFGWTMGKILYLKINIYRKIKNNI